MLKWTALLLAIQLSISAFSQRTSTEVEAGSVTYLHGNAISFLASGDTVISIAQARLYYRLGLFQSNRYADLNLGIASDNYWVRFGLVNKSSAMKLNVKMQRSYG